MRRILALLLLAASSHASPISLRVRDHDNDNVAEVKWPWKEVKCSDDNITDAKVLANVRWESADTNTSWKAAVAAWQAYAPEKDEVHLKFPAFISDFYGGPEGWDCQDPVNTPCSTTVQCSDTEHPAGYGSPPGS